MDRQPLAAPSLPEALGHLRVSLQDAFRRAAHQQGLTPPQAELLCAALAPASVGWVAGALRCDRTNVTHLADRAARNGWLERHVNERDRRSSLLALTPAGRSLATNFLATLEGQLSELLDAWSEERQTIAATQIREIAEALDREPQPCGQLADG